MPLQPAKEPYCHANSIYQNMALANVKHRWPSACLLNGNVGAGGDFGGRSLAPLRFEPERSVELGTAARPGREEVLQTLAATQQSEEQVFARLSPEKQASPPPAHQIPCLILYIVPTFTHIFVIMLWKSVCNVIADRHSFFSAVQTASISKAQNTAADLTTCSLMT